MTPTTFEDRLLVELRAIVAEQPTPAAVPSPRPVPSPRLRRVPRVRLTVAVGAVAATLAGVLVATSGNNTAPAYAVAKQADGSVTVEIHSLSDGAGLREKLREAGIPAVVDYTPVGKTCRVPRGRPAGGPGDGLHSMGGAVRPDHSATFTIRGQLQPGQTLVIMSTVGSGLTSLGVQIVEGPVAPCQLVDAPPLRPSGASSGGGKDGGPSLNTGGADEGTSAGGFVTHTTP